MANVKVKVGAQFRSVVADANILFTVTRKVAPGVWEARSDDADYGCTKVFKEKEIASALGWAAAFRKLDQQHEDFYARVKLGSIVHYHNGFGQYVRCRVVVCASDHASLNAKRGDTVLLPLALVGNWREWDLPRRRANGSIYLGYHAEKIVKGEIFCPNAGCIYENPDSSLRNREDDPRKLPAIDLSVPPLSETERALAAAYQRRAAVLALLNQSKRHPADLLAEARALLDEPLRYVEPVEDKDAA